VDWPAGANDFRTVEAVLGDISTLGACVQVEERIPLDTAVSMSVASLRFSGHVSYCVFRDYGYFVGIKFSEDTNWSSLVVEL